jgi:hypothetical protein
MSWSSWIIWLVPKGSSSAIQKPKQLCQVFWAPCRSSCSGKSQHLGMDVVYTKWFQKLPYATVNARGVLSNWYFFADTSWRCYMGKPGTVHVETFVGWTTCLLVEIACRSMDEVSWWPAECPFCHISVSVTASIVLLLQDLTPPIPLVHWNVL